MLARPITVTRKRAMVVLAAAALTVGFVSWMWGTLDLSGRTIIRGHVGDVAAAALIYAAIGFVARPAVCAAVTAVIALTIELTQQAGGSRGAAGDLLLGRHFDPWDLLAYAIGIGLALLWDQSSGRIR